MKNQRKTLPMNKSFEHPTPRKVVKLASTLAPGLERLERAIAHQGLASRREAKALITEGSVKVNGKIIKEPGYGIKVGIDVIDIKGGVLQEGKESVLVYKPRNIETSRTDFGSTADKSTKSKVKDLHDFFPKFKHLAPIGRLDKESEGLIIMSNDGTLARALTQEDSHVGKKYLVTVRENITDTTISKMTKGITLDGVKTKPAVIERASRRSFTIILHEGRKHQIRRMADACHLTVEELIRTDIGSLNIGTMKAGSVRILGAADIKKLKK
ncbi:MAG: pseudouridine synthase [Candidatus Paceibacterota bacterium]